MKRWRLIPKVTFINYRKDYPNLPPGVFCRVFYVQRFWGGRTWLFGLKAFALELDFRRDWIKDMATNAN